MRAKKVENARKRLNFELHDPAQSKQHGITVMAGEGGVLKVESNDPTKAEQDRIEKAILETEKLKEGAFEPFLEHPFMQAILFLLAGGVSLPALINLFVRL